MSDTIGIDIVLEELESAVGGFNVDLYASEEGTGRKIIIENQLEDTNHDHLGKIITYASGKGAEVIVWIVKRARDEHRLAIEWLNQHTDSNIGIFLLEIELWQINDSPYAPKFNIVERPNAWAKSVKATEGVSDTKKLQMEFWQAFVDYAFANHNFSHLFKARKPQPQHWYDLSMGKSAYHLCFTVNTQKKRIGTEIYISDDKETFNKFKLLGNEIEKSLGEKLEWIEASKACRILATKPGDIKKAQDTWAELFEWFMKIALKFREITQKFDS